MSIHPGSGGEAQGRFLIVNIQKVRESRQYFLEVQGLIAIAQGNHKLER